MDLPRNEFPEQEQQQVQSVLQVECGSQLQAKSIILFLANAHYKVKFQDMDQTQ